VAQIIRRIDGGDLVARFSDDEIVQLLSTSTTAVYLVTHLVAIQFHFDNEATKAGEIYFEWSKH
jgi:hypothetical protein